MDLSLVKFGIKNLVTTLFTTYSIVFFKLTSGGNMVTGLYIDTYIFLFFFINSFIKIHSIVYMLYYICYHIYIYIR